MKKQFLLFLLSWISLPASHMLAIPLAIHRAASTGNLPNLRHLLAVKSHVHIIDGQGWAPIHHTSANGHADGTQSLIIAGADPLARTYDKVRTPAHLAARNGHDGVIAVILRAYKSRTTMLVRARDADQRTPLHLGALSRNVRVAQELLRAGASINAQDLLKNTPLHLAALIGDLDMVIYLVSAGASLKALNTAGLSPFYLAAMKGHLDLLPHLDDKCDHFENLKQAETLGHGHVTHTLIVTRFVSMPHFYLAIQHDLENTVQTFIDLGFPLNSVNPQGFTLLHVAARYGRARIFSILEAAGAISTIETPNGETALDLAALHGTFACVDTDDCFSESCDRSCASHE